MNYSKLFRIFSFTSVITIAGYIYYINIPENRPLFINSKIISNLPQKDASKINTGRLADGLVPPTNKWYSGIALQKTPRTVFPSPLSFTPSDSGFYFNLPKVDANENTIFSSKVDRVTVEVLSATSYKITRYDELSVTLTYSSGNNEIGSLTLVAGSPYIQFRALQNDVQLLIYADSGNISKSIDRFTFTTKENIYTAASFGGSLITPETTAVKANMPFGSLVTLYGLPITEKTDILYENAMNYIVSTKVSYEKINDNFETNLKIETENKKPTTYSLLPHQTKDNNAGFSYDTIYGEQSISDGTDFKFTTPNIQINDDLELDQISTTNRELLILTLRQEINGTRYTATDSYFGGKELYRSAQLLQLAQNLGETEIAGTIKNKLKNQITSWLSTADDRSKQYFYYDTRLKTIVGVDTSFGTEEANDHHFHYGYFIYAAAIISKYDNEFKTNYGKYIDILVADIANYDDRGILPIRRYFDPYFGHSWASGTSPFDDGNNQESSSEALNAWIGTVLWADITENKELKLQAEWMLSNETRATDLYWMNISTNKIPSADAYKRNIVSLNWGGKRDYSTFFSSEPNAKLGILLLPMSPTTQYQKSYGSNVIDAHINEAVKDTFNIKFGDYLLMYSALGKKNGQLEKAKQFPDSIIDEANSRSYMYAWIMSLE